MKRYSSLLIVISIFVCFTSCKNKNTTTSEVEKNDFGVTTEGDSVYAYVLKNKNGMEVTILNYGGVVQSVKVPDKNGKIGDVVLGFNNIEKYQKYSPYFGALIGRFGNRIAKGTFTLNDSTYHVPINDGPNSLHGGKKGFDKRIWDVTPFNKDSIEGLKLHYLSPDGEEGYRGNLVVDVTKAVNNHSVLEIGYNADTADPTILDVEDASFSNPRVEKDSIKDYILNIDAVHFVPVDSDLVP